MITPITIQIINRTQVTQGKLIIKYPHEITPNTGINGLKGVFKWSR
jgi:HAMP domain-containing protein